MKKSALFGVLFILLIFTLTFTIAEENDSIEDSAYACLESKVKGNCDSLSVEEKIFSLLAIGECKSEVLADSNYKSDIKLTAQAIMALDRMGANTDEAEEWLLSKNTTTENIIWLLQIATDEGTTCSINYEDLSTTINIIINEDETLSFSGEKGCLSLYGEGYSLRIGQNCYGKELSISCVGDDFLTTLLYKYAGTTYVSEKTSSASAGGTTTEQVNSLCFSNNDNDPCDYEDSLWASVVLNSLGYESSAYIPYLITMMNDPNNYPYIPEAFLYLLTNQFRNDLLSKQDALLSKQPLEDFYDIALALYPFQYEDLSQKTADALKESQGNDGCWNSGNVRDTAFLLYSIWPRSLRDIGADVEDDGVDCESAGYYCMSAMSCQEAGGNVLTDYDCSALFKCCDTEQTLDSCEDQGGEICDSNEICSGGTSVSASNVEYGEICCVDGTCKSPSQKTECEDYDGSCRTTCYSDEEESYYSCDAGEICCIEKTISEKKSYVWVWILLVLIFLVIMGIVFKDRLRPLLLKLKSKFGKGKSGIKKGGGPRRPGFPPVSRVPQRRVQRRILPPAQRRPARRPSARPKGEMDDVLKKLKEMSK
ncbi:hypothetical protein KAR52_01345 [Candidatus Pacearchaeota archaeon]|nr:hypothetical protein [Candidatus Pacearchaeota archaeon]